jgi:predicted RNase H-like HicB family nuclease
MAGARQGFPDLVFAPQRRLLEGSPLQDGPLCLLHCADTGSTLCMDPMSILAIWSQQQALGARAIKKNLGKPADNREDGARVTHKRSGIRPQKINESFASSIFYCVETNYTIQIHQEDGARWIAEVPELPGVMVYGDSQGEAILHVQALALRRLADQIERSEHAKAAMTVSFASAWVVPRNAKAS